MGDCNSPIAVVSATDLLVLSRPRDAGARAQHGFLYYAPRSSADAQTMPRPRPRPTLMLLLPPPGAMPEGIKTTRNELEKRAT